jgi:phytoene synthase
MNGILKYPYYLVKPVYEKTAFHRSVIDEVDSPRLRDAYRTCRIITRTHAKTFYLATRFLPNKKQRSIFAIYSLCRFIDDLVDEAEDLIAKKSLNHEEIHEMVDSWKKKLTDTYNGTEHDHTILIALSDVLKMYHIPLEHSLELIEGVSMDLTKKRYNNFDELYDYSYKVASVVGLMTSEVFGYHDKSALKHAVDLGIAMQLTNILRDVGEDLAKDRIYLPADELNAYNLTEDYLFSHTIDDRFIDFMEFQIKRAESYYESADIGISMLNNDSRYAVYLARQNYSRILNKIRKNGYDVFSQRAYLTTTEKLSILPKVWFNR